MKISFKQKDFASVKADATVVLIKKKPSGKKTVDSVDLPLLEEMGFFKEDRESAYVSS